MFGQLLISFTGYEVILLPYPPACVMKDMYYTTQHTHTNTHAPMSLRGSTTDQVGSERKNIDTFRRASSEN